MVERNRFHADLHLVRTGRRRRGKLGEFKLAVGNEGERTHQSFSLSSRWAGCGRSILPVIPEAERSEAVRNP
jgi:hypothetical protein